MTRTIDIEALCADKGLRITEQRKVIARVLGDSEDHPDVETLHQRASAIDSNISIAGRVIEFVDDDLEELQNRIAERLGFRLVDHRMELYGVTLDRDR